ncbi:lysophospholipid acyltransferase family protein [Paenibacillus filicis]|uniref:Lysophospholipid acyltransferase family protein n=1 Tax=Paenibacillus filicis TaxID=669464 RepID=A0ABU9DK44_9BACL
MYKWIGRWTGQAGRLKRLASWMGLLPQSVIVAIGWFLATLLLLFSITGLGKRVLRNIQMLLPRRSELEHLRIRYDYFYQLVMTHYELLVESERLYNPKAFPGRFTVEGEEHLEQALGLGRGAIVYTAHCGNFFYYYWYLCQKYDCLTVATASSEELRPLFEKFAAMGCPGLDYDHTPPLELMRRLRTHLRNGGVVFLLGDFYRPAFPLSSFFGQPSRSPDGTTMLSIELQTPVIPFCGWRKHGFAHHLSFEPALHLASSYTRSTRSEATVWLNRKLERMIRERPEQWFYWFNAEERWEVREPHAPLASSQEDAAEFQTRQEAG